MRNQYPNSRFSGGLSVANWPVSRRTAVGAILIIALVAFEIFNFDTTQYALRNLLGDVRFIGLQWASILAIAFCSIDFAGLIRLFTPQKGLDEPKEVWYLMGAWLLGATMNAIMTWWAISLTLLNHQFGNEVLTREQLLLYVPIFVAILVWLTRILFIGAFTVAGEHIFDFADENDTSSQRSVASPRSNGRRQISPKPKPSVARVAAPRSNTSQTMMRAAPKPTPREAQVSYNDDMETQVYEPEPIQQQRSKPVLNQGSRVRQRPPRPTGSGFNGSRSPMRAQGSDRRSS